jgi:hypothetical protein
MASIAVLDRENRALMRAMRRVHETLGCTAIVFELDLKIDA